MPRAIASIMLLSRSLPRSFSRTALASITAFATAPALQANAIVALQPVYRGIRRGNSSPILLKTGSIQEKTTLRLPLGFFNAARAPTRANLITESDNLPLFMWFLAA